MSAPPPSAISLWLPALRNLEVGHPLRQMLVRADRLPAGGIGYFGGLGDFFQGSTADLPAAALTRDLLAGDAGDALWLSADPAWVQPDMNGVRLLACGRLQLSEDDAAALADAVRPVIHDAGMRLEVSTPDRWHLQLPDHTPLPAFAAPEQAMGEDLSQHLPQGPEGRRWRVLLNEIQVLLHQHPLNAERRARGLPPVNSLWLWGGGRLPDAVSSGLTGVISDDVLLGALAHRAGLTRQPRTPANISTARPGWLIDLQDLPAHELAASWWPALQSLLQRHAVLLHFASGERWLHRPAHRWRFWRRAAA